MYGCPIKGSHFLRTTEEQPYLSIEKNARSGRKERQNIKEIKTEKEDFEQEEEKG